MDYCRGCSGTCCTGQGSEPCTCPELPVCGGCGSRFKAWGDEQPADRERCANCQPEPPTAEQRIFDTITELAARWHRAAAGPPADHAHGRMEGYVQTISLLLDEPVANIRLALNDGAL